MNEKQMKELTERLDIIIKLMVMRNIEEDIPIIAIIEKLNSVGIKPAQIGKLLDKPTNYITACISRINKKQKNNK